MIEPEELRHLLDLGVLPAEFTPNINISPGQMVPVVISASSREVFLFRWGLIPGWAKDPKIGYKMFNARAETIADKPSFRVSFQKRRCLILADGFYEWKKEGNKKVPYLFSLGSRKPFTFAGLWDSWKNVDGQEIRSCTIITTSPNALVNQYHDRMPVILEESVRWHWLEGGDPNELKSYLKPIDQGLMAEPIPVDLTNPR